MRMPKIEIVSWNSWFSGSTCFMTDTVYLPYAVDKKVSFEKGSTEAEAEIENYSLRREYYALELLNFSQKMTYRVRI
ncbi:hypothetical protein Tco_0086462 [Tanacetum coccineum]